MSGSTIGGLVGAVIGSFIPGVGTQIGFMLGSAIGGYLDPQKIKGPQLSDATRQTGQEGVPIPIIRGTAPTSGNVVWCGKVIEHKKTKRQGKGGPKVTEYTYTRSYAIGICEGPIDGILLIKRNGKIVYDARTAEQFQQTTTPPTSSGGSWTATIVEFYRRAAAAQNSKFIQKCTIYLGAEDELPDPTIEAVEGVGNVSPMRGLAKIVVKDDDVTELQGAVPQFEFVVVASGTPSIEGSVSYAAGEYGRFADTAFPLIDPEDHYTFTGSRAGETPFTGATIAEVISHFSNTYGVTRAPDKYLGYFALDAVNTSDSSAYSAIEAQGSVVDDVALVLVYNDWQPTGYASAPSIGMCPYVPRPPDFTVSAERWSSAKGDLLWMDARLPAPDGDYVGYNNCVIGPPIEGTGSFPRLVGVAPLYITVTRKRAAPLPGAPLGYEEIPDAPGHYVNDAGDIVAATEYVEVAGTFKVLATPQEPSTSSATGPQKAWWEVGPCLISTDPNFSSEAFWTAAYVTARDAGLLPAGWTYGVEYPAVVASAYQAVPTDSTVISPNVVSVGSIVAELCARVGVTDVDVSEIAGEVVDGYKIATEAGADAMIAPLMQAKFFDASEYDGVLHFPKRGAGAAFTINTADLAEREPEALTLERVQEAELLRKVIVGYIDPGAVYTPATQAAERRAATVAAKAESSVEIPIVCSHTAAAQIAEKRLKVAWGEPEKLIFSVTALKWARLVPAAEGWVQSGSEYLRARVMDLQEDSGVLHVEATRTRQNLYIGTVTGAAPTPPPFLDPALIGPTRLVVMDLPALREDDDRLGVYVAAGGILPGWQGAETQFSGDGGETFAALATVTDGATVGRTTTALSAWIDAETPSPQTVTVTLNEPVSSLTRTALLRYGNRAAVQLAAGGWEVLQFETATANSDGTYTLGGLVRGRYATTPGAVSVGARFVLLDDSVKFVPVESWALGQSVEVRAVSLGTDADAATSSTATIEGKSQTEWPPAMVSAVRAAGDVTVTWVGRGRIGAETAARNSQFFGGYRVTFSDGHTADVAGSSYTYASAPDPITVSVAALNSITGAGPSSQEATA